MVNILYVSTLCSENVFKEIYDNSIVKPQQQAQKFHDLLCKGFAQRCNHIDVMSRPPINRSQEKKVVTSGYHEISNGVTYYYLKVLKTPLLRHIHLFMNGLVNTAAWIKKNKIKPVIICDVLSLSISIPALLVSKFYGVKSVAIVTDVPKYMQQYVLKRGSPIKRAASYLYKIVFNYFLCKYNFYVVLTKQINDLVNPYGRPYVVIEGMVDKEMINVPNDLENKHKDKVVLYAGALNERYGVRTFLEAFSRLEDRDARLWIYGSGEMEKDIKDYEEKDNRISYFGVVPNETVVKEQQRATLLVNPRPSREEFTKYSFPSKNMEYMVSGTPVLTTPLQGMPGEYFDYVYLFRDETVEGMTKKLGEILGKNKIEIHEKGLKTKEFVLKYKNNLVQADKILDMVKHDAGL